MQLLSGRMKEQSDAYSKYVIASCTVLLLAKNLFHTVRGSKGISEHLPSQTNFDPREVASLPKRKSCSDYFI